MVWFFVCLVVFFKSVLRFLFFMTAWIIPCTCIGWKTHERAGEQLKRLHLEAFKPIQWAKRDLSVFQSHRDNAAPYVYRFSSSCGTQRCSSILRSLLGSPASRAAAMGYAGAGWG